MSRLNVVQFETSAGKVREVFDEILQARGWIGNIHRGIANSPAVFDGFWQIHKALRRGKLPPAEVEAVRLIVSEEYGCRYCIAAHTMLGKRFGLAEDEMLALRRGAPSDAKLRALAAFVRKLMAPKGAVSDEDIAQMRSAGYDDATITEVVFAVALTIFTNLFNRVHDTPLDELFPPVPAA
jgi:uncharacterized peroxidase-related enzyme